MARMKDCPECKANDIPREEWDYANDGPYPAPLPMRVLRKEHSYCGLRVGGGAHAWSKLMFRPNGDYMGTLIHNGRK